MLLLCKSSLIVLIHSSLTITLFKHNKYYNINLKLNCDFLIPIGLNLILETKKLL